MGAFGNLIGTGKGSDTLEPEGSPHPSPLKPGGWPVSVSGQPGPVIACRLAIDRDTTGTGTCIYRRFWESE